MTVAFGPMNNEHVVADRRRAVVIPSGRDSLAYLTMTSYPSGPIDNNGSGMREAQSETERTERNRKSQLGAELADQERCEASKTRVFNSVGDTIVEKPPMLPLDEGAPPRLVEASEIASDVRPRVSLPMSTCTPRAVREMTCDGY